MVYELIENDSRAEQFQLGRRRFSRLKTGSTLVARKPVHASQPSSPSLKPAVACRSPSAIISLLPCPV